VVEKAKNNISQEKNIIKETYRNRKKDLVSGLTK
jgi:hypothetical protein